MNTTIFIREREEALRAKQTSEERYSRLLASVTDYVYSVRVESGLAVETKHGVGCEAVTGYSAQELQRDPELWLRMVCAEDREEVLAHTRRILNGEAPPPLEHRIICKKGSLRWIRNTTIPRRDPLGLLVGYDGLVSDITERKLAQEALRESEERLALVIQGSNDGIWDWNLVTDEVYFSPRWKSMLGYSEEEIEHHVSAWEALIHPDDRAKAFASINKYLSGLSPTYELEHRLQHKDGTYRWILARGVAQRDQSGRPVRLVGSHIDLTERTLAMEQLQKAYAELALNQEALRTTMSELKSSNEQLKEAQLRLIQSAKLETVGTLAAGVAHEVKNPLQTILMGLDFLVRNLAGAGQDTTVVMQDMREAVSRANAIISELLQLSGSRDFELRAQDVNELIERALWLVNNEVVASRTRVALELGVGLPQVRMDRSKIEQVLINLFINALQAMSQEGLLTVRTRQEAYRGRPCAGSRFNPGDALVIVEVQDTGPGISIEHLHRVFDPFFTTKPVGEGTGLGLSVVRQIVDLHGGLIELKNAQQGGAVATIYLKAADTRQAAA